MTDFSNLPGRTRSIASPSDRRAASDLVGVTSRDPLTARRMSLGPGRSNNRLGAAVAHRGVPWFSGRSASFPPSKEPPPFSERHRRQANPSLRSGLWGTRRRTSATCRTWPSATGSPRPRRLGFPKADLDAEQNRSALAREELLAERYVGGRARNVRVGLLRVGRVVLNACAVLQGRLGSRVEDHVWPDAVADRKHERSRLFTRAENRVRGTSRGQWK